MKHSLLKILFVAAVTIGATAPMIAQTTNPWLQQWYRDKFGRSLPDQFTLETPAHRTDRPIPVSATTSVVAPANAWFENWYRDKYGRPSPLAQASQQNPQEPARHLFARAEKRPAPVNTWFEQWYRDKFGRPSPQEESRLHTGSH